MSDDVIDDAVVLGFLRSQEIVPFHVLSHLLGRFSRVLGQNLLQTPLEIDGLAGLDLDIGRLPLEAARDLVDQDLGVRQGHALYFRPAGQDDRPHRHRDPDAGGLDVGFHVLHRVVEGEPGVHLAARRVDVDLDVLLGVLGLEMDQLGDDEIRDLVVDRSAEKDDPLVEQTGVDVERTLATRGLLDHHGNQRAHFGVLSLLPGVHSFVSVVGVSLTNIQIASRAASCSGAMRSTSPAMRSRVRARRMFSRSVSYAPAACACSMILSGSSKRSRKAWSTSSSETWIPSWSAAASSTSSPATEAAAWSRRRLIRSSGESPDIWMYVSSEPPLRWRTASSSRTSVRVRAS